MAINVSVRYKSGFLRDIIPYYSVDSMLLALGNPIKIGSAYLQSMDFQKEPQSKHHLYFLDCFFFTSWPTRPNPTHIANANPNPHPS